MEESEYEVKDVRQNDDSKVDTTRSEFETKLKIENNKIKQLKVDLKRITAEKEQILEIITKIDLPQVKQPALKEIQPKLESQINVRKKGLQLMLITEEVSLERGKYTNGRRFCSSLAGS